MIVYYAGNDKAQGIIEALADRIDAVIYCVLRCSSQAHKRLSVNVLSGCEIYNHVCHESFERLVLNELFVEFGVVLQQRADHTHERSVQFDTRRIRRVFLGVLVGLVRCHLGGDVFGDSTDNTVAVGKEGSKLFIEHLQNVAESIHFRVRFSATVVNRHRIDSATF